MCGFNEREKEKARWRGGSEGQMVWRSRFMTVDGLLSVLQRLEL